MKYDFNDRETAFLIERKIGGKIKKE